MTRQPCDSDGRLSVPYRLSLLFGMTPMFIGVCIFLVWVFTRQTALMVAGILNIWFGLVLFVAGLMALFFAWHSGRRMGGRPVTRRAGVFAIFILFSNFPLAAGLTMCAVLVETRYAVLVRNETEEPIHGVRIVGGGIDRTLGTLPPGRVRRGSFWVRTDGTLELWTRDRVEPIVVCGYVTNGQGGTAWVTFAADGSVSVRNAFR